MPFHLYNSLMGVAKESLQGGAEPADPEEAESGSNPAVGRGAELVDLGPDTEPEVLVLVDKLRDLLKELPKAHIATLRYIVGHLRRSVPESTRNIRFFWSVVSEAPPTTSLRIAELEEDNKMSPGNLGIVFGPSLMRPRPTGATISLSSLVDYPHQARIVEALIVFYSSVFQCDPPQSSSLPSQQVPLES